MSIWIADSPQLVEMVIVLLLKLEPPHNFSNRLARFFALTMLEKAVGESRAGTMIRGVGVAQ